MPAAGLATSASVRHVEQCMGTVFSFDVRLPDDPEPELAEGVRAAVRAAVQWLHRVDRIFSTYRPDSDIRRLDRGDLTLRTCSPLVREVLDRCAELERGTAGFFSARAGGTLDPSGYVKGWAVERASDILAAAGSTRHCVNGGGDIQCAGRMSDDRPWTIGIVHPHRPDELIATVAADGLAIATSGTAERGEHVVDPHTRRPARGLECVTVVGPRLAHADALATAAFAMGTDARSWLATVPDHCAIGMDAGGATWTTGAWAAPQLP